MHKNQPIGILDSGLGGLTVVKEIIKQLPNEQLIYVGDTARCPYGPRPADEVRRFTLEIVDFLLAQDVKSIVIACNTATAYALDAVREHAQIPVIGVIRPGSIAAVEASGQGRIGVIGTVGTISSGAYQDTLRDLSLDDSCQAQVVGLACPTLVSLVEEDHLYSERDKQMIVAEALKPLQDQELDSLILGCTHYPLITDYIRQAVGDDIKLISSAEETAKQLAGILADLGMLNDGQAGAQDEAGTSHNLYYTTGDAEIFRQVGERWLDAEIEVKHIELAQENRQEEI